MCNVESEGLNIKPGPWAIRKTASGEGYAMTLTNVREVIVRRDRRMVVLPNGERLVIPEEITNVTVYNVDPLLGTDTSWMGRD